MRPIACLAVFLGLPLSALADECPTAADIEAGIRFSLVGGDTEIFVQRPEDIVASIYIATSANKDEPAVGSITLLNRGFYTVRTMDFEGAVENTTGQTTFAYASDVGSLPLPTAGEEWVVDLDSDFSGSRSRDAFSAGEMTEATIGACTYDMIPLTVVSLSPVTGEEQATTVYHWLPELGISQFISVVDADGQWSTEYENVDVLEEGALEQL